MGYEIKYSNKNLSNKSKFKFIWFNPRTALDRIPEAWATLKKEEEKFK